jgi:hypothetical protein
LRCRCFEQCLQLLAHSLFPWRLLPPDARLKSGGTSPSALASTFAPSLARRSLSLVRHRASGVRVRARGCSTTGRCSCRSPFPSRAAPALGPFVHAAGHEALGHAPTPGEGWPPLRRVGAWPPRARRVMPIVGRRWRGDAAPAPGRNCLRPRPHRRCIRAWGHAAAWSVSSGSSQSQRRRRLRASC